MTICSNEEKHKHGIDFAIKDNMLPNIVDFKPIRRQM